ncbi:hypothetical protein PLICRDRAFT_366122 [Plicaturopsis crispa FD-325 SS-3]|uniref:Uncharacterized protein n=1 Tax=Plicaturopsis crispa FD-325 SS-3 TaxID=944288 RepID=A0A0C9T527_PLICR|nr:hypothetical protein PLICRDRAFT_366122 [Plicaturopsis crispa FD-325 SS-3]
MSQFGKFALDGDATDLALDFLLTPSPHKMSDVRALLKAKRQEARVTHPLASYSAAGQLRCAVCASVVKHASAWEGHIGSKAHRTNVARLREEERAKEEQALRGGSKRKAEEASSDSDESKRRRTVRENTSSNPADAFPSDFFSDSTRAPLPPTSDDSEDESVPQASTAPGAPPPGIDEEWERFTQAVINAPDQRETYERATVFAEPQVASETPEGFPLLQADVAEVEPNKLTEEEARRKKEEDERELIMDRLLDEERAQEEADMKVTVMKSRLEALKKRRESARKPKVGDK